MSYTMPLPNCQLSSSPLCDLKNSMAPHVDYNPAIIGRFVLLHLVISNAAVLGYNHSVIWSILECRRGRPYSRCGCNTLLNPASDYDLLGDRRVLPSSLTSSNAAASTVLARLPRMYCVPPMCRDENDFWRDWPVERFLCPNERIRAPLTGRAANERAACRPRPYVVAIFPFPQRNWH